MTPLAGRTAAVEVGEPVAFDQKRVERILIWARLLAAAVVFALGYVLPSLGMPFVVMLSIFFAGYSYLLERLVQRAATADDVEWVRHISFAADVAVVGLALFVFAPDPEWSIYPAGFLAIVAAGTRVHGGGLLAAASLSLTYLVIGGFRQYGLGIPLAPEQMAFHLGTYLLGGLLVNAILPELDGLRLRETEIYDPLMQVQEAAGEALLVTENDRPVFWNETLTRLSGYGPGELRSIRSVASLIAPCDPQGMVSTEPQAARLLTKDGRSLDVAASRRTVGTERGDRDVWILRDVTEQHRNEDALRHRALHDTLTGLPNRTLLEDRLRLALLAARRQNSWISVLLLDLDGFKRVNDLFGHRAGDEVLIQVASRLSQAVRESDTVARLGGDEFVLLLVGTSVADSARTAHQLVSAIKAPIPFEGQQLSVGASIGIASFPGHAEDPEVLLRRADAAMYAAKRAGGGCAFFSREMEDRAVATAADAAVPTRD